MARTAGFALLRRALRSAASSSDGPAQNQRISAVSALPRIGRRRFGTHAAYAAGVALAGPVLDSCSRHDGPRIAIVGAGLAGLVCALRLRQAGMPSTLHDAQLRVGGRVWTGYGKFDAGQFAELGGEFIDSDHRTLRTLCRELGLTLDDLSSAAGVRESTLFFGGRALSEHELVAAFVPLAERIRNDLAASKRDPLEFARLDRLGLEAWLDAQRDLDATLRKLLEVVYIGEYGLPASEQSAFNLLRLIDAEHPDPFRPLGDSDERFRVRGGNAHLTTSLAAHLSEQIELGQRLVRVAERADRKLLLTFVDGSRTREHSCDALVLALPFSMLREVELRLPLPAAKRQMIAELGYGTNAKLIGQFQERTWLTRHNASGSTVSDLQLQSSWDASRAQPGEAGLLTIFCGGATGRTLDRGTPEARMQQLLPDLHAIFPGSASAYAADSARRMHWPNMPFALGSYACYRPGQAAWSGQEGTRVGAVHFCGEHTSVDQQGYMEGAAESGVRVAGEILATLGRSTRAIM